MDLVWVLERWRQLYQPILVFEIWFSLLATATFVPATAWLMNELVAFGGGLAIGNTEMVSFFLSAPGLVFLLVAVTSVLTVQYIEYAGLLVIVHTFSNEQDRRGAIGVWPYLVCFPKLIQLGLIQTVVAGLLILPWLLGCLLIKSHWLGAHDINYYLADNPREWYVALVVAALWTVPWVVAGMLIFVRWLSAVPLIVFEDQTTRNALVVSWRRSTGSFWRWVLVLTAWNLVVLGVFIGLAAIIRWTAAGLLGSQLGGLSWTLVVVIVSLSLIGLLGLFSLVVAKVGLALLVLAEYLARKPKDADLVVRVLPSWMEAARLRTARIGIWVLIVIVLGAGGLWIRQILEDALPGGSPLITAHRGSSWTAPENTLSALRQAIADGADYAEIDVQTTADGKVVLLHDADFMRMAGADRKLEDLTLAEARTLDLGRLFSEDFTGERVATLQEAIELCRGRLRLNIELKYNRPDPTLAGRVGEILHDESFTDQCIVMSLDWTALTEFRERFPEVSIGLIVFKSLGRLDRVEADAFSMNASGMSMARVRSIQKRGAEVHVWTVNDPRTALEMIEMGADNLITDTPGVMRQLLTEWESLSDSEKTALQLRRLLLPNDPLPAANL